MLQLIKKYVIILPKGGGVMKKQPTNPNNSQQPTTLKDTGLGWKLQALFFKA